MFTWKNGILPGKVIENQWKSLKSFMCHVKLDLNMKTLMIIWLKVSLCHYIWDQIGETMLADLHSRASCYIVADSWTTCYIVAVKPSQAAYAGKACPSCSNYIFILDSTPGFSRLHKDNCKMRQETFKFWDLVHLILEIWQYTYCISSTQLIHSPTSYWALRWAPAPIDAFEIIRVVKLSLVFIQVLWLFQDWDSTFRVRLFVSRLYCVFVFVCLMFCVLLMICHIYALCTEVYIPYKLNLELFRQQ